MNQPLRPSDKTSQFGEDNIFQLMMRYSFPAIVAMLVQSSYNFINMTFVGNVVGSLGIAAIAICNPITQIISAMNALVGNGCSTAVAIRLGQGDRDGSRALVGSSVAFMMLMAVLNVVFGKIFIDQILRFFGASDAILPLARDYLNITLYGMILNNVMNMNPMMRIEGYPTRAMATQLLSTVVNLICSPTFLFVFKMGIKGAALGTLCAQFASGLWIMTFLMGKNRVVGLKWKYFRIKIKYILQVMQFGLPNFLMSLTQSLLSVTLNRSLGAYGGDVAISAWGITNNINNLIQQPIFGLNQGAQPIIGYNVGARKYKRVRQAMLTVLGMATAFSTLGWLITRLFPGQIIALFNKDPELIAVGTSMLVVFRALVFVVGLQQAGAALFQQSGKPNISIFLSLTRQVFVLIPCLLILPRYFGFNGILYSGPISDVISTVITVIFILFEIRRLNRLIREETGEKTPTAAVSPDEA